MGPSFSSALSIAGIQFHSTGSTFDPPGGQGVSQQLGFIVAYDRDGVFLWADAVLGNDNSEHAITDSCAAATDNSVYLTGRFINQLEFVSGAFPTDPVGPFPLAPASTSDPDLWIARMGSDQSLQWIFSEGGTGAEDAPQIRGVTDAPGFYLSGSYASAFDLGAGIPGSTTGSLAQGGGSESAFIAQYLDPPSYTDHMSLASEGSDTKVVGLKAKATGGLVAAVNYNGDLTIPQNQGSPFNLVNIGSTLNGTLLATRRFTLAIEAHATLLSTGTDRLRDTEQLPDHRYRFGGSYSGSNASFGSNSNPSAFPLGNAVNEEFFLGDLNPDGSF